MTATTATAPSQQTEPRPRRFTAEEYHRMGEAGIFTEDDRVELLEGEIVEMSPIDDPHVGAVDALSEPFFAQLAGTEFRATVQNPIRLGPRSEPQPDLAVVRRGRRGAATAADVLLVVEVADSSRHHDRNRKVPLYAAAGIPEVWLVDLVAEVVERYAEPRGERYRHLVTFGRGETVTSAVLPALSIPVDAILG